MYVFCDLLGSGQLDSVSVLFSSLITGTTGFEYTSSSAPTSSSFSLTRNINQRLFNSNLNMIGLHDKTFFDTITISQGYDGTTDYSGPTGRTFNYNESPSDFQVITDSTVISYFIGSSTSDSISLGYTSTIRGLAELPDSDYILQSNYQAKTTIKITYQFVENDTCRKRRRNTKLEIHDTFSTKIYPRCL